jgi:tetratricopeptide (TPR) repeat protein
MAVSSLLTGLVGIGARASVASLLPRLDELERQLGEPDPAISWSTAARSWLTTDVGEQLRAYELATRQADAAGDARMAWSHRVNAAFCACELGDYARAEAALRAAVRQGERFDADDSNVWQNLGLVLYRRGALIEAGEALARAINEGTSTAQGKSVALSRLYNARVELARGDAMGARDEARVALGTLVEVPGLHAFALAVLAEASLACQDVAGAREAAAKCMSVIATHGEPEEGAAYARFVHARAFAGTPASAQAIAAARAWVDDRASRIGDPELRQTYLTQVPEVAAILGM